MTPQHEVNRFVSHEYRLPKFDEMVQEISTTAKISTELVRKFQMQALKEWETSENRDLLTLFCAKPEDRQTEINKMINYFSVYMRPLIQSEKRLHKTLEIASHSLEEMYELY